RIRPGGPSNATGRPPPAGMSGSARYSPSVAAKQQAGRSAPKLKLPGRTLGSQPQLSRGTFGLAREDGGQRRRAGRDTDVEPLLELPAVFGRRALLAGLDVHPESTGQKLRQEARQHALSLALHLQSILVLLSEPAQVGENVRGHLRLGRLLDDDRRLYGRLGI